VADSLLIANSIELLGGPGGTYSTFPGLTNTIFALNDGNDTFDLGAPQPTVDILASLITDGERPIGRRASNRTLSIPISIISDTRDNLTLARETLFQIVDAQQTEQFTITYTRDYSSSSSDATQGATVVSSVAAPLVLECFRAEPATLHYSQPAENQFIFEVIINCQALPYGRSDTPETITFYTPATGTAPPPSPITLDTLNSLAPGQPSVWQLVSTHVTGTASVYCPSLGTGAAAQVTHPVYKNMSIGGPIDLTAGTGTPQLNVIQFWAGFASQQFYSYWKNHQNEVRFYATLYDIEGNTVAATRQYTLAESNSLASPKWTSISIRLPVDNQTIDWTNIVGYAIQVQNYGDATLRNSNVFLDDVSAVAPSASVANTVRGSIYKLNGVDGTVHASLNIIAQQQPATSATTVTITPGETFTDPAGVTTLSVSELGPGGAGGSAVATSYAGGGGGAEYVGASQVSVTPGKTYAPTVLAAQKALTTGAFSGFTQVGTWNNAGPTSSPAFSPSATASGTLILTIAGEAVTSAPTSVTDTLSNTWTLISSTSNTNSTIEGWVYAAFNATTVTTSGTITVNGLATTGPVEMVLLDCNGIAGFGRPPSQGFSGDDTFPRVEVAGFINTNATTRAGLSNWSIGSGADTTLVLTSSPGTAPYPTCLQLGSILAGDNPGVVSGYIGVNNGESVEPKILGYIGQSTAVNLITTWYAMGYTVISSVTDAVTFSAGSWQWKTGTVHAPPTNAQYYTVTAQIASSAVAYPLSFTHLGAVYTTPIGLAEIGVLINYGGENASTPVATGWTHAYGTAGETPLCMDVFYSSGSGVGGDICAGSYSSATQWASMSANVSLMAGQTIFPADSGNVIADGGCSVPLSSSTGGAGGSGGTYDTLPAPVHNDGGPGANGASPDGGGGGSTGGTASGSRLAISSGTITEGNKTPPIVCMSPLPVRQVQTYGNATLVGGDIYNYGADGLHDTVFVVVLPESTGDSYTVTDTQGNTYSKLNSFGTSSQVGEVWYCNESNNGGGYGPLSPGVDSIIFKNGASFDTYLIYAYAWRDAIGVGSSFADGFARGNWASGTTSTLASGTLTNSNVGMWVLSLATDSVETQCASNTVSNLVQIDDENYSADLVSGSSEAPLFFNGIVLDTWWQNTSSTSATTFTFTHGASVTTPIELGVISVESAMPGSPTWSNGVNAGYYDGISKFSKYGGATMTVTFGGTHAQLMGKQGPDQGQFMVNVDGGPWQTIDNYSQNIAYQQVLFDTGTLPNATHTMNILVLGRNNPSSSNTFVDIDGYQILTGGVGNAGAGVTGGAVVSPGGAGGNGGANAAGAAGSVGSGGGGASSTSGTKLGGNGGVGWMQLQYYSTLPAFNTLILHRPSLDGSKTLQPYIACQTQAVPTADTVQPIDPGTQAHFNGTYTIMVAANTWNTPANSRTVTATVYEFERPGGAITDSQSVSLTFTPNSPPPGMGNNIIMVGELTLPNKAIPPDNTEAYYTVEINSTNTADTIQDVMFIDTMGQTVYINDALSYAQFFVDEPTPDSDLGLILGSQYDRTYAISVLDSAYPSGGPLTAEPGDNILFAYSYQGAPALICTYFPRYYIDRPVS
jgi:hypothetical protein